MKLVLHSNFFDFYDFAFDRIYGDEPYRIFHRCTTDGPSRSEIFPLLADFLKVPSYGAVTELAGRDITLLVVYTNSMAHRGEGKQVMTVDQALEQYPYAFASEYIYRHGPARSYRTLQIGRRRFRLGYYNIRDWRSNVGIPLVRFLGEVEATPNLPFPYPLWAIDSVPDQNDVEYAVDFNCAPELRGSGIEQVLRPNDIYQLIKEAL